MVFIVVLGSHVQLLQYINMFLDQVKNLHRLCAKGEQNDDLVGRVYPHLVKIFNRCSASLLSQKASTGLLLLVGSFLIP